MYYQKLLYSVAVFLFITGVLTVSEMSFKMFLVHKLVTSILFTVCYFYIGCQKHKIATIIMLLFVVFDGLTLYIESPIVPKISLIIRTITFILLCSLIVKKLNFKAGSFIMTIAFTVIAISNGYVIFLLVDGVGISKFDLIERIFAIFPSVAMILMCVCSANYNFNRFHLRSTLFLIATYCLAFSDITVFNGYYRELDSLFYIERFFSISAFLCFVNYVMLENKKRKQNSVKETAHYY